jgi:hypothetical protein
MGHPGTVHGEEKRDSLRRVWENEVLTVEMKKKDEIIVF